MILRVTFKTPDALDNATDELELEREGEFDVQTVRNLAAKWIKWGESVTIEIDLDAKTAIVLPANN